VLVAIAVTPVGYLLGSQTGALPEPSAQPALAAALRAPENYAVTLRVEPPEAEIWLDQEAVGSGYLDRRLARDGAPHELKVEARGYLPLHVLFLDTPPPFELRLEPDSALERPAPSPTNITASDDTTGDNLSTPAANPATGDAAKARKRPAPTHAPLRREPPHPSPRSRPHASAAGLREASARQSAASSSDDPVIHVLD
jgi:hypothetical protein